MKWKASKITTLRTLGLLLMLAGLGIMVLGTGGILLFGEAGKVVAGVFLVLGLIGCLASTAVYFYAGVLSTSAPVIDCPECGKRTKMLGTTDRCMYCHTILTWDPELATEKPASADPSASP